MTTDAVTIEQIAATTGLDLLEPQSTFVHGSEPVLESRFALATAAAVAHALVGDRVRALWRRETGVDQTVTVERRAAAASLVGFALLRLRDPRLGTDGWEPAPDGDGWIAQGSLGVLAGHNPPNAATNAYRTADGRWIQLHGGYPHLAAGLYELLGSGPDRDSVARRVAAWDAIDLEDAIADAGLCGVVARTADEWRAHPQGAAIATVAPVDIVRIGDAPPPRAARPPGPRPLSGVRVLDLTRVLAGPTCARALAAHGAEVLNVRAPHGPAVLPFVLDTGFGKRSAFIDLAAPDGVAAMAGVLEGADVVCDSYRTGALERHGLGPHDLAERRPGVVVAQLNCYGFGGPWDARRGWEQLAQNATGIATPDDSRDEPLIAPAAACDYTTGALLAAGVLDALRRRRDEGGSWLVRASLCRTAMWIHDLPRVPSDAAPLGLGDLAHHRTETRTAWGRLEHQRPLPELSVTPPFYDRPPSVLGADEARWLP